MKVYIQQIMVLNLWLVSSATTFAAESPQDLEDTHIEAIETLQTNLFKQTTPTQLSEFYNRSSPTIHNATTFIKTNAKSFPKSTLLENGANHLEVLFFQLSKTQLGNIKDADKKAFDDANQLANEDFKAISSKTFLLPNNRKAKRVFLSLFNLISTMINRSSALAKANEPSSQPIVNEETEKDKIDRSITSTHNLAFSKNNFFKINDKKEGDQLSDVEQFLIKRAPLKQVSSNQEVQLIPQPSEIFLWNEAVESANKYIKNNTSDSRMINALNECIKINQEMNSVFTEFYLPTAEARDSEALLQKMELKIASLQKSNKSFLEKVEGLKKQSWWPFTKKETEKESEAKDMLYALGLTIADTITKIIKDFCIAYPLRKVCK